VSDQYRYRRLNNSTTHPYTVGPQVNVQLPRRFSFDANLLYKRLEYTYGGTHPVAINRWELPLLFGYRFTDRRWQPFVHLGVVHIEGINIAELRHQATQGIAGGAGVERELRPCASHRKSGSPIGEIIILGVHDAPLRSNLTPVEVLVSVSYRRGT
jgi:hypothetical protein